MGLWTDWRIARERRQRASDYLRALAHDPDLADVAWLASVLPSRDELAARRELRVARRALAMIVAERDALDDQTASDVNHVLAPVLYAESRRDPVASELWNERWRAYTQSIAARGAPEAPPARLARVMLEGAGVVSPTPEQLARGVQIVQGLRAAANEALRSAFGAVSLPEDVRPSALRPHSR